MDNAFDSHWRAVVAIGLFATLFLGLVWYRWLYLAIRDEHWNSRELIENLSEGIYRSTLEGGILSANRALARLNGCDSTEELLGMVNDIAGEWYVDPERRNHFRRILMRDGQIRDFVSEVYRYKTRECIWVVEGARLVRDPKSGRPLYYEGSVREITETVKRLQLEEFYTKLINQVPGGLFQLARRPGEGLEVVFASPGVRHILGFEDSPRSITTEAFFDMIKREDRAMLTSSLQKSGRDLSRWDCEVRILDARGDHKWLRITATPEASGGGINWHGYISDCSLRKKQEMAIERLAYNDPLTDLPNRRMLLERVGNATRKCARHSRHGALLFLDLDNFKELNDSHGHHSGDAFLKLVAERLRSCVGDRAVVARMGGDEFVVLVEDAGRAKAEATRKALRTASQIVAELRRPYDIGDIRHVASASIGVVVFDGVDESADDIMRKADVAMYRVKAAGRDGLALFEAENGTVEPPPRTATQRRQPHRLRA